MKVRPRLHSFLARYWCFFLPWLIGFCLPPVRDLLRLQFIGSTVSHQYSLPWSEVILIDIPGLIRPVKDPVPDKDFESQVTAAWAHKIGSELAAKNGFGKDGVQDVLGAQRALSKLEREYPRQQWLATVRLLAVIYNGYEANPASDGPAGRVARELVALATREAEREPKNAFPLLVRAHLQYLGNQPLAAAASLRAAARRTQYRDGSKELSQCIFRAFERKRRLELDERLELFESLLNRRHFTFEGLRGRVFQSVAYYRGRGETLKALDLLESSARCGWLMTRQVPPSGRWGRSALRASNQAQWYATYVNPGTALALLPLRAWNKSVGGTRPPLVESRFLQDCARAGAKSRGESMLALVHQFPWNDDVQLGRPGFDWSPMAIRESLMLGGSITAWTGNFLIVLWILANVFLFRGVGEESTRQDRIRIVAPIAIGCLALGGVQAVTYYVAKGAGLPPYSMEITMVVACTSGLIVLSPVLISLLLCAHYTHQRNRKLFEPPERLKLEMNLTSFQFKLLTRGLPVLLGLPLLLWPISLCLLLVAQSASWQPWPLDFLLFLGPVLQGAEIDFRDPGIFAYLTILSLSIPVLFFGKWRWGTHPRARVATHSGLRWWKECLGWFIIIAGWLWLLFALLAWSLTGPTRERFIRPYAGSFLLSQWHGDPDRVNEDY